MLGIVEAMPEQSGVRALVAALRECRRRTEKGRPLGCCLQTTSISRLRMYHWCSGNIRYTVATHKQVNL